jgi:integral membrane protein
MTIKTDNKFLKTLRTMSFIEGTSTLILFFVAMPLKYVANMPLAVTIFGSIHGLLFLVLIGLFFVALDKVPISLGLMIAGIFGAVIPFGPFVVDRWLKKLEHSDQ